MSSLCFMPSTKVLAYTYNGDVPMSPYTIPRLWNARCIITGIDGTYKLNHILYMIWTMEKRKIYITLLIYINRNVGFIHMKYERKNGMPTIEAWEDVGKLRDSMSRESFLGNFCHESFFPMSPWGSETGKWWCCSVFSTFPPLLSILSTSTSEGMLMIWVVRTSSN